MALDTTAVSLKTHVLVTIKLTGKTLRIAERHVTLDDGFPYDGRLDIKSTADLQQFQSTYQPIPRVSSFTLKLDNRDQGLSDDLDNYIWGNRDVEIRAGEGTTVDDYSLIFTGFIEFPTGISRSEDYVWVRVVNAMSRDNTKFPTGQYTEDDFPDIDPFHAGRVVPILYGDFTDSPTNTTPCTCIDTTTNLFECSGSSIVSVGQVFHNGVAVAHSLVSTAPQGRFTITTYTASSDIVTARIAGKTGSGVDLPGSFSDAMTHPVDQLYDMMNVEAAIPAARIDLQSFIDTKNVDTTLKGRRFLDESKNIMAWAAEVANEFSYDLYVTGGCYTLAFREPAAPSGTLLRQEDMVGGFTQHDDPNRQFANRIKARYNYDPAHLSFNGSFTVDGTTSQTDYDVITGRTVRYYWQYDTSKAENQARRELLINKRVTSLVTAEFKHRAMLLELTDSVVFDRAHFSEVPMLVRGVDRDWNRLRSRLTLWNVPSFADTARWSADSEFSYFANTIPKQQELGFWADEIGTVGLTHTILDTFTGSPGTAIDGRLMDRGGTWKQISAQGAATPDFQIVGNNICSGIIPFSANTTAGAIVLSSVLVGEVVCTFPVLNDSGVPASGLLIRWVSPSQHWRVQIEDASSSFYMIKFANGLQVSVGVTNTMNVNAGDSILVTCLMTATGVSAKAHNLNDGSSAEVAEQADTTDSKWHGIYHQARSGSGDIGFNDFKVIPGASGLGQSYWY